MIEDGLIRAAKEMTKKLNGGGICRGQRIAEQTGEMSSRGQPREKLQEMIKLKREKKRNPETKLAGDRLRRDQRQVAHPKFYLNPNYSFS